MTPSKFGTMPNGTEIFEFVIRRGDLTVKVINLGAIIRDVRMEGVAWPLVLGFERLEHYLLHSPYFGAIIGRHANRVAGGQVTIDGRVSQLSLNENGRNHLHGGFNGFDRRVWQVIEHDGKSVTLAMTSADGEEGYPGSVDVVCCYSLEAPGTIRIELEATTDAPTLVNLAQHSYFNLCGDEDILDHRLLIHADTFTPVDGNKIPTGNIAPVADTPYDFRDLRRLRCDDGTARTEYDINFVVGEKRAKAPCPIARLEAPRGDLMLEVLSTEPGVQFYDGCMMPEIPVPGLDGRRYGRNSGCCLEPQLFPDSANHPAFCSAVLRPSQTYRQTTLLSFSHR